ncbi:hypothetical protein FRC00_004996 [Tulasnella sp. 408]|nr:hypothetical protein FRC00_004996 [Tulasnella sp. 408]
MSTAQLNKKERRAWKEFLACPHLVAVTNRLVGNFEMWAPDVYKKYDACHKHILSQLQALDCINPEAPRSVPFAALTANLGPQTVCWPHRDIKNLANGICIVLVLGSFNHQLGGHIVLHEAALIVEMKPGEALFLPSAVVTHETIPIRSGETRYSLVFYSAGGLFRWQDCGSRTNTEFKAQDRQAYDVHFSKAKAQKRWVAGCNALPTLDDLWARCGISHSKNGSNTESPTTASRYYRSAVHRVTLNLITHSLRSGRRRWQRQQILMNGADSQAGIVEHVGPAGNALFSLETFTVIL